MDSRKVLDVQSDFASLIATKLEKSYPYIRNYFAFDNDDKALSMWYGSLNEADKSLVSLYLQFKMSDGIKL